MKLEVSNDTQTFRLVDGIEDTDSYVTGTIAEYGERSILDETAADPWYAEIDDDGEWDGLAHNASSSVPIGCELDCEFADEESEEESDEDEEDDAEAD